MSVWALLFRDAPFWVAAFVFLAAGGVLVWLLWQLLPGLLTRRPKNLAVVSAKAVERRAAEATPVLATGAPEKRTSDVAALAFAIEQRLADILRRIASLERTPSGAAPAASLDINPLLKRLEELAGEMNKVKLFLADAPGPVNTDDIVRRLAALEKAPGAPATGPAPDLGPVTRRVDQLEQEITKIKMYLAELPSASPAAGGPSPETARLVQKVDALQKVLESLSLDTEAAKPS